MSLTLIQRPRLEFQNDKGGISPLTPPKLTLRVHSLPPILHITHRKPLLECSEGARGLSVLMRATGVFTGITVSPSLSLRQQSDRYAIHAGRNLPDKEFRYLRTVIVTAAVYRGFDSQLRPIQHSFFQHRTEVTEKKNIEFSSVFSVNSVLNSSVQWG
jgi:hypothetical protein